MRLDDAVTGYRVSRKPAVNDILQVAPWKEVVVTVKNGKGTSPIFLEFP